MLIYILLILGVIMMFYSLFQSRNIIKKLKDNKLKGLYNLISLLILIFLLGYIIYILSVYYKINIVTDILVSLIFFFGAVFVVAVMGIINKSITKINNQISEISMSKRKIENKNEQLKRKEAELRKAKEKIENKNKKLEETLDDFYTLRTGLQEQIEKGIIKEENLRIKKKLDDLKIDKHKDK